MTARNGSAVWRGDLESGSGTVTVGDGVFEGAYSSQSRFAEGEGTASPACGSDGCSCIRAG